MTSILQLFHSTNGIEIILQILFRNAVDRKTSRKQRRLNSGSVQPRPSGRLMQRQAFCIVKATGNLYARILFAKSRLLQHFV